MYRRIGIVWGLVTLFVAGIVGVIAYNLGASSVATTAAGEAGRVVVYPGYYGFGFGFFWIFPLLFLLFIVFGIFGRWGRGYGGGKGWGYGDPRSRLDRWHQEAHGTQPPQTPEQSQPEQRSL